MGLTKIPIIPTLELAVLVCGYIHFLTPCINLIILLIFVMVSFLGHAYERFSQVTMEICIDRFGLYQNTKLLHMRTICLFHEMYCTHHSVRTLFYLLIHIVFVIWSRYSK